MGLWQEAGGLVQFLEVEIKNYKSLKSVAFRPGPLSAFIGPNGAGKSNLCDALDFIGEMYRLGLELAVARHGGYENICYRHTRRSKSPIVLHVVMSLATDERLFRLLHGNRSQPYPQAIILDHRIALQASDQGIRALFRIVEESVEYSVKIDSSHDARFVFRADRRLDKLTNFQLDDDSADFALIRRGHLEDDIRRMLTERISSTGLLLSWLGRSGLFPIDREIGLIDLYQLNPKSCRSSGVPTPTPALGRDGDNLPAIISALKGRDSREYQTILDTLRVIMPTLEEIAVVNTPQRTLGLAFQEAGFGRPWTSEDVSDGTIRALGLLASLFNPDSEVVIIEEPENSLHPWAIGQFVEACRVASQTKQVMLTTHSPVLINHLRPDELWVVERANAETKVSRLVDLDPDARVGWEEGRFTLSEYLDSGIVPGAVPAAPL
jgi:predicted ATPase